MDEDYLKKVEEQKRMREEIARKKNQTRVQTYVKPEEPKRNEDRSKIQHQSDRPRGPPRLDRAERRREPARRQERDRQREPDRDPVRREDPSRSNRIYINDKFKPSAVTTPDSVEPASPDAAELKKAKLKAYLAVVVNNVKQLENVYKRISLLASSVGATKVSRFTALLNC